MQLTDKRTSTVTDTVPGQLVYPNLDEKVELKYSRSPITVTMHDLIRDWSEGLINDEAYIRYALKIERVGREGLEDFDITKFCDDWEGYTNSDKSKRLKESKVTAYIQKMQQKGAATVEIKMQLRLEI